MCPIATQALLPAPHGNANQQVLVYQAYLSRLLSWRPIFERVVLEDDALKKTSSFICEATMRTPRLLGQKPLHTQKKSVE
ncbi:Hypothetical protein NTJ_06454 [Nesidiocoris tenuis]|uniref:Ras-GEF domain-containing protein n=1 Tax=Nesidiocoris tenuis TaxID=355587 RepID=A0ABN7ARV0_9HEMI|nr:Hypothetical protein NTJ_06454 [Nesidiocoris tenuis]